MTKNFIIVLLLLLVAGMAHQQAKADQQEPQQIIMKDGDKEIFISYADVQQVDGDILNIDLPLLWDAGDLEGGMVKLIQDCIGLICDYDLQVTDRWDNLIHYQTIYTGGQLKVCSRDAFYREHCH